MCLGERQRDLARGGHQRGGPESDPRARWLGGVVLSWGWHEGDTSRIGIRGCQEGGRADSPTRGMTWSRWQGDVLHPFLSIMPLVRLIFSCNLKNNTLVGRGSYGTQNLLYSNFVSFSPTHVWLWYLEGVCRLWDEIKCTYRVKQNANIRRRHATQMEHKTHCNIISDRIRGWRGRARAETF
jgi:hypothetical protein